MNIQLPSVFKTKVRDTEEAQKAQYLAPKHGPRAGKLLSPGQLERKLRRIRRADSAATARKSRRSAFRQNVEARNGEQDLRGIARVYLLGSGNEDMRRNVTRHVEGLAEKLSKASGEPYGKTLEAIRGQLTSLLVAWGDLDEGELVA